MIEVGAEHGDRPVRIALAERALRLPRLLHIQAMVADALRGHVMAIHSMMFMGMASVGALLAGTLASHVGAPLMVATGGTLATVGAGSFYVRLPALRPAAQRLLVTREAEDRGPADREAPASGPSTKTEKRRAPG
jgi:hypothetical protein